jgi:anthraniloyl-CoA monooxygenase
VNIVCVGAGPAGLYFAILSKLRDPESRVTVLERYPEGVTYGWGVTFSDDVLDSLHSGDPDSAAKIFRDAASWGDQVVRIADKPKAHMGGYGFAIGRQKLLTVLADRARALGVEIIYENTVEHPNSAGPGCASSARSADGMTEADLIVIADGVNSRIRQKKADEFGTRVDLGRNYYLWVGTPRIFAQFTYGFEATSSGWIWYYAYPFNAALDNGAAATTFIVECSPETWQALHFDSMNPAETRDALQRIFARHLGDSPLLMTSASARETPPWLNFPWVTNQNWHLDNLVLMGDAAHTTHFSIGNGTKLAIDDALELDRQLNVQPDLSSALSAYQNVRASAVAERQQVAHRSAGWFEEIERRPVGDPVRFSYSLRTRGFSVPTAAPMNVSWLLHLATQFSGGRRARHWISVARRRRRRRATRRAQFGS